MTKALRIARLALATSLVLASTSVARGNEEVRTQVTIRGSGTNVTIEETLAPVRRPIFERKAVPVSALGEAIRLKTEGADDGAVVAYLRAREAELPPVIDAGAMARLRRAGAGKSVTAYLATVAAVDIGKTGEGGRGGVSYVSAPEAEAGMPVYDASSGYPFYSGYASAYTAWGRRAAFSHHRGTFPRRHSVFHGGFPSRGMPGRHRMR